VRLLRHPAVHWTLAVLLGAIFVYASLDKIAHPDDFARIVYHYRILGPSQTLGPLPANLLAVTLPWVEVVAGLLLLSGVWRREAAAVAAILLVAFLGAVAFALTHGIDIENCGCFTVTGTGRRAGVQLLLGDVAMLAAALILTTVEPRASGPFTTAEEPA
jgi:uncharacterized membrane protein YphA (DoxX/SURF4 family)